MYTDFQKLIRVHPGVSEGETTLGLLDDIQTDADGAWTADLATIIRGGSGFSLDSSERVTITPVMLLLDDGVECAFAGRGLRRPLRGNESTIRVVYFNADPVQARIEVDDTFWFISTTQVQVFTRGNPTEVELVLEKV